MDAQQFHQMLKTIKETKDNQERQQIEQAYLEFRSVSPSDTFLQLIINEVVTKSDVQEYAQVLLRQDIDKNGDKSSIHRLSNRELGKSIMLQLLQFLAEQPDIKLAQIVAAYAQNEFGESRQFPQYFDFIVQSSQLDNTKVREVSAYLVSTACEFEARLMKNIQFDFMSHLQKLLEDKCDDVAVYAIHSLGNLVVNNDGDDDIEAPIPLDVVSQIGTAIIVRIGQALQNNSILQADKMLTAFENMISEKGSELPKLVPSIIQLCEQIMQLKEQGMPESTMKLAVDLFSTTTEHCELIRKEQKQMFSHFIRSHVIPNLVLTEVQIQNWLTSDKDFVFHNNDLSDVCEDCLTNTAFVLGKNIQLPLIHEVIQQAQKSRIWQQQLAAVVTMTVSSKGMKDVIKGNDVKFFAEAFVEFMNSEHPRTRFEVLNGIAIMSKELDQKLQKHHKALIPLMCAAFNDPEPKVSCHSSTALTCFMSGMSYELIYQYLPTLYEVIKMTQSGNITAVSNGLSMFSTLCDIVDAEDLEPLMQEFIPLVFQQFEKMMAVIVQQELFDFQDSVYIQSLVEMLGGAIQSNPDLFENYIDLIMSNFVIIAQRSIKCEDHQQYTQTMDTMTELAPKFAHKMLPYVQQLYPTFSELLHKSIYDEMDKLEQEGEQQVNQARVQYQGYTLIFLADFMDTCIEGLSSQYEDIFNIIINFSPYNNKQTTGCLYCMAQLLHMATACSLNPQDAHNQLFKRLNGLLNPDVTETMMKHAVASMEDQVDAIDALAIYLKFYAQFHLKFGDETYQQTVELFFNAIEVQQERRDKYYEFTLKDLGEDDMDDEEKQSSLIALRDQYKQIQECIGQCFSMLVKEFKDKMDQNMLLKLYETALGWVKTEPKGPKVSDVIEGVSLFSDFAMNLEAAVVKQLFEEAKPYIVRVVLTAKEEFELQRDTWYTLQEYLNKTQDVELASNSDLLMVSIELLDAAKKDDGEEALGMYDNICSYLCIAGKLAQQPCEFWQPLIQYCVQMDVETDEMEVYYVVKFFCDEIKVNKELKKIMSDVVGLLVSLFFGRYYSFMKKDEDWKQLQIDMRQFFQRAELKQMIEQAVGSGSDFVKKNFANFWK